MAIKQDIKAIKNEIGAEEQFLEGLIKGERVFKKYKYPIIAVIALIILTAIGYGVITTINENRLIESNKAYQTLLKDESNKEALQTLKDYNKPLYETYLFQKAMQSNNTQDLQNVLNSSADSLLKEIANFSLHGEESELLEELSLVLKGYGNLKKGNLEESKKAFSQIPLTSPLQELIKKLNHYQGK